MSVVRLDGQRDDLPRIARLGALSEGGYLLRGAHGGSRAQDGMARQIKGGVLLRMPHLLGLGLQCVRVGVVWVCWWVCWWVWG